MLNSNSIFNRAAACMEICRGLSLEMAAQALKILYLEDDLGSLLGLFTVIEGRKVIIINQNLEPYTKKEAFFHELGHCNLHSDPFVAPALDSALYHTNAGAEYEANAFAAHCLLDSKEVLEMVKEGYSLAQLAASFCCSPDLVLIKLKEMKAMGYKINVPMQVNPTFLSNRAGAFEEHAINYT